MQVPAILVADPNPIHRALLSEILTEEGYRAVIAIPSSALWAFVVQAVPRLVLLDMSTSPSEAWTLLGQLRRHPPTTDLPIILCATNTRPLREQARYFSQLHCFILDKPFHIAQLLDMVAELLGAPPTIAEIGSLTSRSENATLDEQRGHL